MSNVSQLASDTQSAASNPSASAWVSANAGSGKTHVLVNRVVRLLLTGTSPERILCLTYTRAAAAEMSRRLFDELAGWLALTDDDLVHRIHDRTGHVSFEKNDLAAARRLFARALETPGGLKVQTIHAFCERLLQRFPVEAGLVPGFEVMDDQTAREVLAQARAEISAKAREDETSPIARHLATIVGFTSADRFDGLLKELLDSRQDLAAVLASDETLESSLMVLSEVLGLAETDTPDNLTRSAVEQIDETFYRQAAGATCVTKQTRERIERMLLARAPDARFAVLKDIFLKADGAPRAQGGLVTAKAALQAPDIHQFMLNEQNRVCLMTERLRACRVLAGTGALLHVGQQVIEAYEANKRRLGLCDYDDLVLRTRELLEERQAASWVLYKLDGGLDHILIDEAQDTSPQQWSIIARLTEEFFAGEGARTDVERTVFAVGDYKQSIFSFQGADPAEFASMQDYFRSQIAQTGNALAEVPLQISFRSTPEILQVVDAVFANPQAGIGLDGLQDRSLGHTAKRSGDAGLVELWPLMLRDEQAPRLNWRAPTGLDVGNHPRLKLARQIATTIRAWIDDSRNLKPHNRAIQYSDILILVRRRTTFMDAMVRALKLAGIPVAGADRLELTKHIAVQDLIALARFALLPEDDLTLASVLKSPLVACDDGQPVDDDVLFELAHDRGRHTLWQRLHSAVQDGQPYSQALDALTVWRDTAGFATPYEFFAKVLIEDTKRQAMLRRLGTEAADPIDAFLSEVLNFQARQTPSLRQFLGWLDGADLQIKRDMDHGANEVRVMTVHGAKGLESNIVILPDTTDVPDGGKAPAILFSDDRRTGTLPIWRLRARDQVPITGRLKERHDLLAFEEYYRLLYVAMTRARDELYVCGYSNKDGAKPESWYGLISDVLMRPEHLVPESGQDPGVWRIEGHQSAKPEDRVENTSLVVQPIDPPRWAVGKPAAETPSLRWFVPSKLGTDPTDGDADQPEQFEAPMTKPSTDRFRRGNTIHKLLQILPDVAPADREQAGVRFLARHGLAPEEQEAADILGEVMRLLENPEFRPVFAPGSRAEVPLAAQLDLNGGSIGMTGQIDRLVVTDDSVLIVDYKTNRPTPADIVAVDRSYIRQLAAYRSALRQLYPGKNVRAALLWTNTARLMEVPGDVMDAALARGR